MLLKIEKKILSTTFNYNFFIWDILSKYTSNIEYMYIHYITKSVPMCYFGNDSQPGVNILFRMDEYV